MYYKLALVEAEGLSTEEDIVVVGIVDLCCTSTCSDCIEHFEKQYKKDFAQEEVDTDLVVDTFLKVFMYTRRKLVLKCEKCST